jgi:hypothetical protein
MSDKIIIRTVQEDKDRLAELLMEWDEKLYTKDKAGGNSATNQEIIEIRIRLKTVK